MPQRLMINRADYTHPISKLLDHGPIEGDADETDQWFDYVGHYGFSRDDVPVLIRLAGESDAAGRKPTNESYAPIYACRALGQLGDAGADLYLANLIDDNSSDQLIENAIVALSMLGQGSLSVLKRRFEWLDISEHSQIEVVNAFLTFALWHPHCRDECVAFLSQILSNCSQHSAMLNGFVVYNLIELGATEAAEVIERAFEAKQVNEDVSGRWTDVQIQLGLARAGDFALKDLMYAGELYYHPALDDNAE